MHSVYYSWVLDPSLRRITLRDRQPHDAGAMLAWQPGPRGKRRTLLATTRTIIRTWFKGLRVAEPAPTPVTTHDI